MSTRVAIHYKISLLYLELVSFDYIERSNKVNVFRDIIQIAFEGCLQKGLTNLFLLVALCYEVKIQDRYGVYMEQ